MDKKNHGCIPKKRVSIWSHIVPGFSNDVRLVDCHFLIAASNILKT